MLLRLLEDVALGDKCERWLDQRLCALKRSDLNPHEGFVGEAVLHHTDFLSCAKAVECNRIQQTAISHLCHKCSDGGWGPFTP